MIRSTSPTALSQNELRNVGMSLGLIEIMLGLVVVVDNRPSRTLSTLHQFWGKVSEVMNVKAICRSLSPEPLHQL